MKNHPLLLLALITLLACNKPEELSSIDPVNWQKRTADISNLDSLKSGSTYLSVYSHIYSETEHKTHPLTSTVSMKNANREDTVYIISAEYYNTSGELLRAYFDAPIFLKPMETVEIVIDQEDRSGGSGANFLFEWKSSEKAYPPLFEAVMISTYGQQGLSFTTQGHEL